MKISLCSTFVGITLGAALIPCQAAEFTVTSLTDTSAAGTLRWAIQQANAKAGSSIAFDVVGTIKLTSPLPAIQRSTTIDGSTEPDFKGVPVVAVDFAGQSGLTVADGARGSVIRSLSLVGAKNAGVTLRASQVTLAGNYIGLTPAGAVNANRGDGVKILPSSQGNLIGGFNPVTGITYNDATAASDFSVQPVSAWQGLRNSGNSTTNFLLCGSSDTNGLLYVGALNGGGTSYLVKVPDATATSVYGPDNARNGNLRLVGSFKRNGDGAVYNHGFVWTGTTADLPGGGTFRPIDYPGATYQYTHSTMGGLAVGNADGPSSKAPIGPGVAYIYSIEKGTFVANVVYPGSKSNTAYGIWYNGGTSYTICGGTSTLATNNLKDQSLPLALSRGFLVDYDSKTGAFTHWKTYRYRNGQRNKTFITHFEGISSAEKGVYTLSADSIKRGSTGAIQGSWVSVRRNPNGTFSGAQWVDLNYDGEAKGISSSNSVYGNNVVGIVAGSGTPTFAFQATVQVGFQLSNVISGNRGNGVGIYASKGNTIAQNYIGTNPAGTAARANHKNGILVTRRSSGNLIGGQEAGSNNPTGSELKVTPVYNVPPQGNLISGNRRNGVLVNGQSTRTILSGNFVGTDGTGDKALGNRLDGIAIENANHNSLIGCTLRQNPFVFYNVVSGNGHDGVRLTNADDITVQANFLGISANNQSRVPNGGDGLNVNGSSQNTQVGGVIPLGNVISGNAHNGIAVRGTASGFISFNTFGGGFAFGGKAPNGGDGILITSTGGNNLIRTCILSGNLGNGLEIGGDASGVQVADVACGTNTDIDADLANHGSGVILSGTAHHNAIGGFEPSVETRDHFAGNLGYGVAVIDRAHDNFIYNCNIGLGLALTDGKNPSIPNGLGGVYLGPGTARTTIGANGALFANRINTNRNGGLTIEASAGNRVTNNAIQNNAEVGVYAVGACPGTVLTANTVTGNGHVSGDNLDLGGASGITVKP